MTNEQEPTDIDDLSPEELRILDENLSGDLEEPTCSDPECFMCGDE